MPFSKDAEFVCILGWDERLYQEALSWVAGGRRAAFVVDGDRRVDPRISLYVMDSPVQAEQIARKIGWAAVFQRLEVIGSGAFKEEIERCHTAAHALLSEAADYWVGPMRNARANDALYRRGMELAGAFAGIPAIVVGAGPSLEKNGHLLRSFEDKALIFAGGSALHAVDVKPHFGASIDERAPCRPLPFPDIPFCYQARMNPANFALLRGDKILFPDSSCAPLNWIHQEEPFDAGWTVGTFMTQMAMFMGCSPIVFVGMDLCYRGGQKYARIDGDGSEGRIQVGDVWTQRDWLLAAHWIETKRWPMMDASEGILRLPKVHLDALSWPTLGDLRPVVQEAVQKLSLKKAARWGQWTCSLRDMDEIAMQYLLEPLWQRWGPVFQREGSNIDVHRHIFFQNVVKEHMAEERRESFYPAGTLKTSEEMKEGKLHGIVRLFWPNGVMKRKCHFEHGVRRGLDQMWDETGILVDEERYP
ncbi:MAG: DUF115 domain-containing protein [Verrucomicrobiota bacterium]|nr:DUF115 domain-containing protein [Verrucomicrobiota bacterium]